MVAGSPVGARVGETWSLGGSVSEFVEGERGAICSLCPRFRYWADNGDVGRRSLLDCLTFGGLDWPPLTEGAERRWDGCECLGCLVCDRLLYRLG